MVLKGDSTPWGSDGAVHNAVAFPTDANFTPNQSAVDALILNVTSLVNLTATRNLVVPNTKGNVYFVFNNTSNAQSIQVIGASGTGVTIATGKRAIVYFDGTNWVRLTADT